MCVICVLCVGVSGQRWARLCLTGFSTPQGEVGREGRVGRGRPGRTKTQGPSPGHANGKHSHHSTRRRALPPVRVCGVGVWFACASKRDGGAFFLFCTDHNAVQACLLSLRPHDKPRPRTQHSGHRAKPLLPRGRQGGRQVAWNKATSRKRARTRPPQKESGGRQP